VNETRALSHQGKTAVEPDTIKTDVYLLPFAVGQVYIWRHEDGLTVVDTGVVGSETAILDALQSLGHDPTDVAEIALTHYHADHCGAAKAPAATTHADVLAHELDSAVISGNQEAAPPNLTESEKRYLEGVSLSVAPAPAVQVNRTVVEGDILAGGGIVVHVPGHTLGSIAIHVPSLGIVFTGDTVAFANDGPILGPFNVDRAQSMASVSRLAKLDFEVACFGHGRPLRNQASAEIRKLARGF
jgi:glyoxylase-like metal-dependent hydrolase (beta-lactamase superfamily II)